MRVPPMPENLMEQVERFEGAARALVEARDHSAWVNQQHLVRAANALFHEKHGAAEVVSGLDAVAQLARATQVALAPPVVMTSGWSAAWAWVSVHEGRFRVVFSAQAFAKSEASSEQALLPILDWKPEVGSLRFPFALNEVSTEQLLPLLEALIQNTTQALEDIRARASE